ncbi:MAG: hypothetical protein JWQ23_3037, partial [Herminiimonas sp.]|nr:hypothetical protein [Herminiimonas sp.]
NLARRSPGAFFAGTVVAGYLLARFMKGSSDRRRESLVLAPDEPRAPYVPRAGAFATPSSAHGPAGTGMSGAMGASGDNSETRLGGAAGTLGADGTPSTAHGTTTVGSSPSALSGSSTGGNSYGNR